MIILLIVVLIKNIYYKMGTEYFPAYSTARSEIVIVKLNLKGYVTQEEFKNLTKVDTSDFALKTNVADIKSRVDDIDVDKINMNKHECLEIDKANPHKPLPWKSTGISNEKLNHLKIKTLQKYYLMKYGHI